MKETVREPYWEIRDLVEVQKKSATSDSYNAGLFNGMELCLSILEKRQPQYVQVQDVLIDIMRQVSDSATMKFKKPQLAELE
jgi:hypothetical protein